MQIDASMVKELRQKTGVGMMKCKQALQDAGGNLSEAEKLLRKQGVAAAAKRAGRATGEGQVAAYIHTGGKIGVLLEVNCETDFAARSDDFAELVRGLSMHVAAAAPNWVRRDEVPETTLNDERDLAAHRLGLGDLVGVGRDDHAVEEARLERSLDRVREDGLAAERPQVLARDALASAARGDDAELHASALRRAATTRSCSSSARPAYIGKERARA